ncbi:hypothetical protein ACWCXE_14300 [Streptomyces sp. NPDC001780]
MAMHPIPGSSRLSDTPPRPADMLLAVAKHFTEHRPASPMTEAARMTVALRIAGTAPAAQPLLRVLPFPSRGITRGEYALRIRKTAWAADAHAGDSLTALANAVGVLSARTFEDGDDVCPMCECWTCQCPRPTGSTIRTLAVTR